MACAPGHFGHECSFNLSTIFYEHDVYANAADLPTQSRLDGWSPPCRFYEDLVRQHAVRFIVEVGVWKGLSAVCLAQALRAKRGGALVAVDTWLGALEFWTRKTRGASRLKPDPTRNLYLHHGYPQVYLHFLANIVREKLQQYVIPFPVPSRLAHDFLEELQSARPDLVHIDAAHEYADASEDIRLWWGLLRPGGVLLGDDFTPQWAGVVRAACEHAQRHALQIFRPSQSEGPRVPVSPKWR
jgi:predicted O-methyltransferase YrrM